MPFLAVFKCDFKSHYSGQVKYGFKLYYSVISITVLIIKAVTFCDAARMSLNVV